MFAIMTNLRGAFAINKNSVVYLIFSLFIMLLNSNECNFPKICTQFSMECRFCKWCKHAWLPSVRRADPIQSITFCASVSNSGKLKYRVPSRRRAASSYWHEGHGHADVPGGYGCYTWQDLRRRTLDVRTNRNLEIGQEHQMKIWPSCCCGAIACLTPSSWWGQDLSFWMFGKGRNILELRRLRWWRMCRRAVWGFPSSSRVSCSGCERYWPRL